MCLYQEAILHVEVQVPTIMSNNITKSMRDWFLELVTKYE